LAIAHARSNRVALACYLEAPYLWIDINAAQNAL
jgi:hypothetical protein